MRENEYPVYPEDDGYDRYKNPYSTVWYKSNFAKYINVRNKKWQHKIIMH
jgi:hypothetical protein